MTPRPAATDGHVVGRVAGRLTVVGVGPGRADWCTPAVRERLAVATDHVGYAPYLALLDSLDLRCGVDRAREVDPELGRDLWRRAVRGFGWGRGFGRVGGFGWGRGLGLASTPRRHASDNREEAARACHALDLAAAGGDVVVVSSGDPGVFAMATAVVEQLDAHPQRWRDVEVEVLPGITAAQALASRVGAPLGHDFCVISLSDVRKPWEVVAARLDAAAGADFVIAIYNPRSRHRPHQLAEALAILANHRGPDTPVVLGRHVGREEERVEVYTLATLAPESVDMSTILIVGSSATRVIDRPPGASVYTPRSHPATI